MGGDDRRGQHRPRRRAAVDQRHPRRAPHACTWRRPARPSSPGPGSRSCSPTTRGWSARPTSPTPGTRGSRRRSRSRATGPRSRELGAPQRARRRGDAPRSPADRRRGRAVLDAAVPRHRIAVADDASGSASAPRSRSSPPTCTSRCRPGRSRTPRRPPPAGCSTRPATAGCGSRRAAACRTCTATRGR